MTITSSDNTKLKQVRKLTRGSKRRSELFAAEGEDLVAAAAEAGWKPEYVLVAAGSGLPGEEVEPGLLAQVSSLGSGTRVIGVYRRQIEEPDPTALLTVLLWGVRDPGNVGTIMRSADAFGADAVICGPSTADPYGVKAVRASMGAIFRTRLQQLEEPFALPGRVIALSSEEGETLRGPITEPTTLVIGAERTGLDGEILSSAHEVARIPIRSDSLNAAMAATVALYEVTRQT